MKKKLIAILIAATLLTGCECKSDNTFKTTDEISEVTYDIEYHRGGRNFRPENTLYSYMYAIESGATTIECDMQLTGDDNIVMSHNPFLDPVFTRDEQGNFIAESPRLDMRTMTIDEIKKYDVAKMQEDADYYKEHGIYQTTPEHASIPTIDEFFTLVKEYGNGIQINIEAKIYHDVDADPRACIETDPVKFMKIFNEKVMEYGMENNIILQSFDWQALIEIKKLNSNIRTSALWSEQPDWGRTDEYLRPYEEGASPYLAGMDIDDFEGNAVLAAHSIGADIVSPYCKELTIDMVEDAHDLGMQVIPWNANTEEQMEAMYAMGVDGIITDNGPLLRDVLLKHGETLRKEIIYKESEYHLENN